MTGDQITKEALIEEIQKLKARIPDEFEARRTRTDKILRSLVEATSRVTGIEFLRTLVRHLAIALNFNYALIGEVTGEQKDSVQTLAVWAKDKFADNFTYKLDGTPCEKVVAKSLCIYVKDVQKQFPDDLLLVEMGIESYLGVPLYDVSGSPIGILVALHNEPLTDTSDARLVLSTFAIRAGIELKRKRAEDDQKRLRIDLERRIQERTVELTRANETLSETLIERQKAQEALSESEELYRTLAESADDFIYIIDRDLTLRYINAQAAFFLGCGKEESIGRPLEMIFPRGLYSSIKKNIELTLSSGSSYFREQDFSIEGGSIWLGTRLNPIRNKDGEITAVLGISRDITERMQWAVALEKERDLAQKYLDVAGVMIVIINSEQLVTLINKKGCEILGYSEEEIVGTNWFDKFIPKRMRDEVKKAFTDLLSGNAERVKSFENPVLTRSGEERFIEWKNTYITNEEGNVTATLSSGMDITERKKTEEDREKLILDLKNAVSNIKTLSGLLPICASCKKIRDDKGYWKKIEVYIQEHSEADFSHGICPDCSKKLIL
ncbi:MAG: PAS domain S-box protein [Deltaproteobacteria bacterium]|nr:PAS domain S-box protein [Deltaproteobacteria bacterium]